MLQRRDGFTVLELVVIIVVLGILAAVGIPKIGGLITSSKVNSTKSEMSELKKAIVGSPGMVAGGTIASRGFENDVGFAPSRLEDLVTKPDSIPSWNRITGIGWHGPYIDTSEGEYLSDAWGAAYAYNSATRKIVSIGSGDSLSVGF